MIKQELKIQNFPTNSQQPHLGVQNLYLSQRVLPRLLVYSKTKPNCYFSSITFKTRSENSQITHDHSASKRLIFFFFSISSKRFAVNASV